MFLTETTTNDGDDGDDDVDYDNFPWLNKPHYN